MNAPAMMAGSVDFEAVKSRQQAAWSSGDYSVIGVTLQIVGETLCEAVDLSSTQRVLDVAAGNGNATLAAARRFATWSPPTMSPPCWSGRASARRPSACRSPSRWPTPRTLPFADRELRRRALDLRRDVHAEPRARRHRDAAGLPPGGKIGLANWTPESFIGQLFKTIGKYLPPAAGLKSPALWGSEAHLEDAVRRERRGGRGAAPALRLPLQVGRSIGSRCSRFLRPGAEGLLGARPGVAAGAGDRHHWRSPSASTPRTTAPWSCRANIWKWS